MDNKIPDVSPVVRTWVPDATEAELIEATKNFRGYLGVVYRIFRRLEAEGHYAAAEKKRTHRKDRKKH